MTSKNIAELKGKLEWLSTHNKNYTKEQYNKIEECLEIVKEEEKQDQRFNTFRLFGGEK